MVPRSLGRERLHSGNIATKAQGNNNIKFKELCKLLLLLLYVSYHTFIVDEYPRQLHHDCKRDRLEQSNCTPDCLKSSGHNCMCRFFLEERPNLARFISLPLGYNKKLIERPVESDEA